MRFLLQSTAPSSRLKLQHALAVAEKARKLHLFVLVLFFSSPSSSSAAVPHDEPPLAVDEDAVLTACRRPRQRGRAQQRSEAQPPHGTALALWLRRQLVAGLSQAQADALLLRERGVEEKRDGRGASDVGGVAAREGAQEEARGEVEEAGGRRRAWRGRGGGDEGQRARRSRGFRFFLAWKPKSLNFPPGPRRAGRPFAIFSHVGPRGRDALVYPAAKSSLAKTSSRPP